MPLRDGRWAAGRIASIHPGGKALICYFFAPFGALPSSRDVERLTVSGALLVGKCGDAAIRQAAWPLITSDAEFDASCWPLPVFQNRDPITGQLRRVVYAEGDLLTPIEFTLSDDLQLMVAPEDGAMGTGFVELRLTRLAERLPPS